MRDKKEFEELFKNISSEYVSIYSVKENRIIYNKQGDFDCFPASITKVMNALTAAQNAHTFIYRGWEAHSTGNPYAHVILRGYVNKHGQTHPNYHYEDILLLCDFYDEYVEKYDIRFPSLIIDTNHCNSDKNPFEQPRIIKEVISSSKNHERIRKILKGFMVESYIVDGRQDIGGGTYGQSITDPCLGWEKTEQLIYEIADMW